MSKLKKKKKKKKKTWNGLLLIIWDKGDKNHINQRYTPQRPYKGVHPLGRIHRLEIMPRADLVIVLKAVSNCCQSSSKKKNCGKLKDYNLVSVSTEFVAGKVMGSQRGFHPKYIEKAFGTVEPRNKKINK